MFSQKVAQLLFKFALPFSVIEQEVPVIIVLSLILSHCVLNSKEKHLEYLLFSSAHLNWLVESNVFEKKNAGAVPGGPRTRGPLRMKGLIKSFCRQDCLPWVFPVCCLIVACSVLWRPVIHIAPFQSRELINKLYSDFSNDRCFSLHEAASDGYAGLPYL